MNGKLVVGNNQNYTFQFHNIFFSTAHAELKKNWYNRWRIVNVFSVPCTWSIITTKYEFIQHENTNVYADVHINVWKWLKKVTLKVGESVFGFRNDNITALSWNSEKSVLSWNHVYYILLGQKGGSILPINFYPEPRLLIWGVSP